MQDDEKLLLKSFVDAPDDQEKLRAVMQLIAVRRDLFPKVDPRESVLQIAKRCVGRGSGQ
jgi:hypothetical protein